MELKILTYNIHKGFNWNNSKLTIKALREELKIQAPDLIFLQEVVGENKKLEQKLDNWISGQTDFLAQDIWPNKAFSLHAIYDHRNHGNVILSKYPIEKYEVIDISLNPLEKRAILFAEIRVKKKVIHAYCTHLNLLHRDRMKQYEKIYHILRKKSYRKESIILAGDFNDWNQKASEKIIKFNGLTEAYKDIHGDYAKTFPSFFPFFKLDRIYTKDFEIQSARVLKEGLWPKISDHLPILVKGKL